MEPLAPPQSTAFLLFDEKIQKWIYDQKWEGLRDAQELAAIPILQGKTDLIIAAATATGKTEAAFLPICSKFLKNPQASALYVSPLKALINDQFSRMENLCENLNIPVHPWHGDISSSKKKKFIEDPRGILLITPESLEAIFVNHGHSIATLFKNLQYIVVDELHSFIGSERGCQLQSLLQRIEFEVRRQIPRIGLSATLSDKAIPSKFLRPENVTNVPWIESTVGSITKLRIFGFLNRAPEISDEGSSDEVASSVLAIRDCLYEDLRGKNNLVFANSRGNVELYSDLLRRLCAERKVPNEFWPHHGSLSKELREDAERVIKSKAQPVSIICTSTLEMGIDIGAVESIAQIGVPPSVASMRQRLGRSGRRGEPAVLRIYIKEEEITANTHPLSILRSGLVQTLAMVNLLREKWYEPPSQGGLHFSTLIQQILSLIAQYGGISADEIWRIICQKGGFVSVKQQMFVNLLKNMGEKGLISQANDGQLLLGKEGEKIVSHYSFYTAFVTYEEYRLVAGSKTLGTLPVDRPLNEGSLLIFGGKRWHVVNIDSRRKVIELKPASGGKLPRFFGGVGLVHRKIREKMFEIYNSEDLPKFLNAGAIDLLMEGRENFNRFELSKQRFVKSGADSILFCWSGDKEMNTIVVQLRALGIDAENHGIAILASKIEPIELERSIRNIVSTGPADPFKLALTIQNKAAEKYDLLLSEELLSADYASSKLDPMGAWEILKRVVEDR